MLFICIDIYIEREINIDMYNYRRLRLLQVALVNLGSFAVDLNSTNISFHRERERKREEENKTYKYLIPIVMQ